MPTWSNTNKSSDPTWQKYTRRGTTPTLGDLANFDFTESISEDGSPTLGDAVISSFSSDNQVWVNQSKN